LPENNYTTYMSSDTSKRYALRGVSAGKEDVHNAIKNIDKGLFPQAFCKIVPDYLTKTRNIV
jgi:phosphoribosylformylglycinamidine cyclo-ligase